MNQLKVTIDLEEYTAGLTGHLAVNGFYGFGEGWFNIPEITNFCESLEQLALRVDGKAELIAGQSNVDGSEYLERFGLRCSVISKTGIISIHVTLTEYPYTDCREEEILKVSGEIKAEVQSVINFATQLRNLCNSKGTEAILKGRM